MSFRQKKEAALLVRRDSNWKNTLDTELLLLRIFGIHKMKRKKHNLERKKYRILIMFLIRLTEKRNQEHFIGENYLFSSVFISKGRWSLNRALI